jgi:hypothetical protein
LNEEKLQEEGRQVWSLQGVVGRQYLQHPRLVLGNLLGAVFLQELSSADYQLQLE